jgi:hypothetical protein
LRQRKDDWFEHYTFFRPKSGSRKWVERLFGSEDHNLGPLAVQKDTVLPAIADFRSKYLKTKWIAAE